MSTPIFDQLVAEFAAEGKKYDEFVAPSTFKLPSFSSNPTTITKQPANPFKDEDDKATMQIPRVVPLSHLNKVA